MSAEIQPAASGSLRTLYVLGPDSKVEAPVARTYQPRAPNEPSPPIPSNLRRYLLLVVFCCAQFFDIYSNSAIFTALPNIADDLKMSSAESTWNVNAYSLTLAAFLLAAGRVSDLLSPKWVFLGGFLWLAVFSLGIGFTTDKVTMIVLRALSGIGAAATIPAALNLIVHLFPEEREQARAISIFGGAGALANVLGLVLGAILLLAHWSYIFFLVTIFAVPLSILAAFLIPSQTSSVGEAHGDVEEKFIDGPAQVVADHRKPKMDYFGLLFLTAAIVLLIFGLSNGNVEGWVHAQTLAPLVLGALLFPAFFFWETRMDPIDALINPATWRLKNFALLVVLSLVPYFWWFLNQVVFSDLFQKEWGTSAIMVAVYLLVNGIAGGVVIIFNGLLPDRFTLKWRIVVGSVGATIGTLLLAFASEKRLYWPLIFPGLLIGSASMALVYVSSNVALILSVPPEHSGVAGGVFNSSLQLGASVGLSIATALQVSFPSAADPSVPSWRGYQSSLLFSMSCTVVIALLTLAFFQDPLPPPPIEGRHGAAVVGTADGSSRPPKSTSPAKVSSRSSAHSVSL